MICVVLQLSSGVCLLNLSGCLTLSSPPPSSNGVCVCSAANDGMCVCVDDSRLHDPFCPPQYCVVCAAECSCHSVCIRRSSPLHSPVVHLHIQPNICRMFVCVSVCVWMLVSECQHVRALCTLLQRATFEPSALSWSASPPSLSGCDPILTY